jgi:hypothetical protein
MRRRVLLSGGKATRKAKAGFEGAIDLLQGCENSRRLGKAHLGPVEGVGLVRI